MRSERSDNTIHSPKAISAEALRRLLAEKEEEANMRLAREFSARLARLQFQEAYTERLAKVTDLYELGHAILEVLKAEIGGKEALLGVVTESQFLEVVGTTAPILPQYALDLMEEAFIVGETLSTTGEDAGALLSLGTAEMPSGVPLLAVPLFRQDGVPLGVLFIEGFLREDRADWLTDFLNLTALAVEDCLHYNQIEQHISDAVLAIVLAEEAQHPQHVGHVRRVEDLCRQIGRELGLGATLEKQVCMMALLHDMAPEAVAEAFGAIRRGKETAEEWQRLMADPFVGGIYPSPLADFQAVVDDMRYLRCRYDGKGNQPECVGEAIPIAARIVAVAEAFEHLTGGRVHRTTMSIPEAIAQLGRYAGRQYDPAVVEALARQYAAVEIEARIGRVE